jgi:Protein of unknown function (DUF4232)
MHHQGRVTAAVLFAAVVLLAGCDSASETPAAEQNKPTEAASGGQVACTAESLEATMAPGDVGSGKKAWNTTLEVRNVGAEDCGLQGAGELSFYAETGAPIKTTQQVKAAQQGSDGDSPASAVVMVAPGNKATMTVHYGSATGTAPANCPTPAMAKILLSGNEQSVEVAPPAEMAAMPPLCGGQVQVSSWAASA